MNKTSIEYLSHSWNPIAMRCAPISEGCTNCWHLRMAKRFAANKNFPDATRAAYDGERSPLLVAKRLGEPSRHRKPAIIGVQFMGDLFHPEVSFDYVDRVMDVIATNPRHTFMVLTKRPERMFDYFYGENVLDYRGPCANLWLGVTVENQKAADERVKCLLRTPAAVRFLSCEPLLGQVDLQPFLLPYYNAGELSKRNKRWGTCAVCPRDEKGNVFPEHCQYTERYDHNLKVDSWLDWCIVGGESGRDARPMHPDWARSIRDDCVAAGVPYFHKQNGVWLPGCKELLEEGYGKTWTVCPLNQNDKHPQIMWRVGKHRAGHLLDGMEWREFPNDVDKKNE